MSENNGVMGWNDEITEDGGFQVLPKGKYPFEVVLLEKGSHVQTTGKLPSCPKATAHIKVTDEDGKTSTIFHQLFLHTSTESFLSQFFMGIGQKKKGESARMDWGKVEGSKGICTVDVEEYNGVERNVIKGFDEPQSEETAYKW